MIVGPHLPDALHRTLTLSSPEPVFILTGSSGNGKSSALAHWALSGLSGRTRVLFKGSELERVKTLRRLVADYFIPYTDRDLSDQQVLD